MMMKRKSDPKDVFKDALGPRTKATYTHTQVKKNKRGGGKIKRWGALLHVCLPCVNTETHRERVPIESCFVSFYLTHTERKSHRTSNENCYEPTPEGQPSVVVSFYCWVRGKEKPPSDSDALVQPQPAAAAAVAILIFLYFRLNYQTNNKVGWNLWHVPPPSRNVLANKRSWGLNVTSKSHVTLF